MRPPFRRVRRVVNSGEEKLQVMFHVTRRRSGSAFASVLALGLAAGPLAAGQRFRRGDSNADGKVDVTDAIHLLGFLFLGAPSQLPCPDSADSNDDGKLDISDPVRALGFLFQGAAAPPPPFGGC